jgi:uncharacterized radical SAM superfamily Fe-S cluster-containing enzyme
MRIISELIKYIEKNTGLDVTDVDNFYTEASEKIMISQTPSGEEEHRYMDEHKTATFSFDVYAKNTNSVTAVATLHAIEKLLDLPNGLYLDGDMEFIKCVVKKTATLIDVTKKDEKIYSSGFDLDYYL